MRRYEDVSERGVMILLVVFIHLFSKDRENLTS